MEKKDGRLFPEYKTSAKDPVGMVSPRYKKIKKRPKPSARSFGGSSSKSKIPITTKKISTISPKFIRYSMADQNQDLPDPDHLDADSNEEKTDIRAQVSEIFPIPAGVFDSDVVAVVSKPKPATPRTKTPVKKAVVVKGKGTIAKKTEVVVAPRFGPDPPTPYNPTPTYPSELVWSRPSNSTTTIGRDPADEEGFPLFRLPVEMFPPEKARWVQLALEKLLINGTVTMKQVNAPSFQRRIGMLYDQSVDKKSAQNAFGGGECKHPRPATPKKKPVQKLNPPKTPKTSPIRPSTATPTSKKSPAQKAEKKPPKTAEEPLMSISPRSVDASSQANDSGGIGDHDQLERKISDTLLNILLKGIMADEKNHAKSPRPTTSPAVGTSSGDSNNKDTSNKKSTSTNTDRFIDDDEKAWILRAIPKKAKPPTNVEDLTVPFLNGVNGNARETFRDVKDKDIRECRVVDGTLFFVPADNRIPYLHSFSSLDSLKNPDKPDDTNIYFRKSADVRGFESEQVKLRYAKSRIFVEAIQPATAEKNYRQVREIITLPNSLHLSSLKVMRGKNNGKLVFEQVPSPNIK